MLNDHGISLQTIADVAPVQIYPAKGLAYIYSFLGKNERLSLSGRPVTDIGYLATSKIYTMKGQIMAFTPNFLDHRSFYLANDLDYSLDLFRTYVAFVERNWNNIPGRPTVVFVITNEIYEAHEKLNSALIQTIRKLNSGYINGARVQLGKLEDFIKTACLTNLTFLGTDSEGNDNEEKVVRFFETINETKKSAGGLNEFKEQGDSTSGPASTNQHRNSNPALNKVSMMNGHQHNGSHSRLKRLGAIMGIAKRSRSINYNDCPSKWSFCALKLLFLISIVNQDVH